MTKPTPEPTEEMSEPEGTPIAEYAKPIYESWDEQGLDPPGGYESWMAYRGAQDWSVPSYS